MSAPKFRAALTSLALVGAASLSVVAVSAPAEAATAPVPVSISKKRIVTMPTVVQPGVNTFAISTKAKQSDFQLAQPAAGYTAEEAERDIEKGLDQGKLKQLKRFEANVTLLGGVGVTADHPASLTVTLAAGHLLGPRHQHQRRRRSSSRSRWPAWTPATSRLSSDVTLKAKDSTKWANKPASMPKKGVFTFTNAADQNHFIEMVKLKKGKTVKDFKKWFLNPEGPVGPAARRLLRRRHLDRRREPRHVDDRRLQDRQGQLRDALLLADASMTAGMPHAFMGMIRGIKVK